MEDQEKFELDMFFYDKNGEFQPMTDSEGNASGDIADYRNIYMTAEREYFITLLTNPNIRERFKLYLSYSPEKLLEVALDLQGQLEYGLLETPEELEQMQKMTPEQADKFHMQKLEFAEGMLCLLLAAIRDKVKIKELVRTMDESNGRSR